MNVVIHVAPPSSIPKQDRTNNIQPIVRSRIVVITTAADNSTFTDTICATSLEIADSCELWSVMLLLSLLLLLVLLLLHVAAVADVIVHVVH